jgi:dihydroxyacetone kinase
VPSSSQLAMATKHVVNSPRDLVNESLRGLARSNPLVQVDEANRVVVLSKVPKDRVALVGEVPPFQSDHR